MISNMIICKPIVKFVIFLTLLIKKNAQPLKNMYDFIKFGPLTIRSVAFFPKGNFYLFFWLGALGLGLTCLGLGLVLLLDLPH